MAQPVLKVRDIESKRSVSVSLLPCKIHHDGPVGSTHAHWIVDKPEGGIPTAHFRGRKLHGKTVNIPQDYRGVLVQRQENAVSNEVEKLEGGHSELSSSTQESEMQITGEFQDMTVWSHESVADPSSDHHIRGMEEWIEMSRKIHVFAPRLNGDTQL